MITKKQIEEFQSLNEKIKQVLDKYVYEKHPSGKGHHYDFKSFEFLPTEKIQINYEWFGPYGAHDTNEEIITIDFLLELLNKK